jgi:hypothetical protein
MTKAVQQNKLNMMIFVVYGGDLSCSSASGPAKPDFHSGGNSRCKVGVYHLE